MAEEKDPEVVMFEGVRLPIRIVMPGEIKTSMKDVGGYDEPKQEVLEFANFLQNRERYERLGAKVPKGAIVFGPPGTGKTLLARATAGEAKVPFIACNSSEFLLDTAADRLKKTFKKAREMSPCILFFDEVDCIGRVRADRYRQVSVIHQSLLECLMTELDGFTNEQNDRPVIVLGATNDEDDIDPALLRPGRFDRLIKMDLPDLSARRAIFNVHLTPLVTNLEKDKLNTKLAYLTAGFSGAKIFMTCNEAAMIAARELQDDIKWEQFEQSLDRVRMGSTKKLQLPDATKRHIATHEAGHAVMGWLIKGLEPPLRLAIMPFADQKVTCSQFAVECCETICTKEQSDHLLAQIMVGKAAEQVVLGNFTSQCAKDLTEATKHALAQVCLNGMCENFSNFSTVDLMPWERCCRHNTPIGPATQDKIFEQVRLTVEKAYQQALKFAEEHKETIVKLADILLDKQLLTEEDLKPILGPRPHPSCCFYTVGDVENHNNE